MNDVRFCLDAAVFYAMLPGIISIAAALWLAGMPGRSDWLPQAGGLAALLVSAAHNNAKRPVFPV